jgi:PTS system nitrogen regulatory IIA component
MDLKIKDVAELLNVSETTIRRWLVDGKIPAYRINHQFRFSRIEIENWVMSCKMKLPKEQQDVSFNQESSKMLGLKDERTKQIISNQIGTQAYSLYRAIYRGGVVKNVKGDTKEEVISESVKIIADNLSLDAGVLRDLLMDRENLMPTGLNYGVAVPHTRDFLLPKSYDVVTVVYCENPIPYGSLDGKDVHTLFFLFACEDKRHLHLLAKLAHLMRKDSTIDFFKKKPDKASVLEYVKKWETKILPYMGEPVSVK